MPVVDSSALVGNPGVIQKLDCDVCIIGSGPAGATIARELAGTRLKVTIVESGGMQRQPQADALNEIENVGWPRVMDQWLVRNRIVGGSSHSWTGRCGPFDDIDFEKRAWVPYSGWPIGLRDLMPYLDRSTSYLGIGKRGRDFWSMTGLKAPAQSLDTTTLLPFFWQYSSDANHPYDYMRFGPQLVAHLGSNVTLLTNATVQRINTVESGAAVRSVEFASVDGQRWVISTPTVVLCAGGIENARLLLSSDNVMPNGLGNTYDLVGRFLMDHPRGSLALFQLSDIPRFMKGFGLFQAQGYENGMQLSPVLQRREQLLNCAAWVGMIIADDDPWFAVKRLLRRTHQAGDLRAILSNSGLILQGLRNYYILRRSLPRKLVRISVDCMIEQRPNADSRITLSERRDRYGMRLSRVDWRVDEEEGRTMRRMAHLVADQFPRMGLPTPVLLDWVRDGAMFPTSFVDVAHPTGTTRMSDNPRSGVVDADCQVHGVNGLFIAGSSIFPTAGHCNPTQMIVALALRLADHLQEHCLQSNRILEAA